MDGAQMQIMVVEDEALVALGVQTKLENLGYSVIASIRSGEEAVQMASNGLTIYPNGSVIRAR